PLWMVWIFGVGNKAKATKAVLHTALQNTPPSQRPTPDLRHPQIPWYHAREGGLRTNRMQTRTRVMGLISRLNELQEAHGYLSAERRRQLAESENVPLYRLQGLVTFYPHFRTTPPPRVELTLCRDMACWLNGGEGRAAAVRRELADVPGVEVH